MKRKEREREQERKQRREANRHVIRVTIDYNPVKRSVHIDCPPDLVLTYGILGYAQGVLAQKIAPPAATGGSADP